MPYSRFSRTESMATFSLLAQNFSRNQWLVGNKYRDNCIVQIDSDYPGRLAASRISNLSLKKYIAASAPLHCIDGWNLLGKAILSCSLGDNNTARHFAYYAELRAAMSLLAFEGIGIFNGKDFTMDSAGLYGPIRAGGTHIAVRKAFEQWARSANSSALIEEIIRPGGVSLKDWFVEVTSSAGSTPVSWLANDWLTSWGYDLTTLDSDRDIRNESSYRPTGLRTMSSMNARFISKFITDMWSLLTPSINQSYYLDSLLLKKAIDQYFAALPVGMARRGLSKNAIRQVIRKLGFSTVEAANLGKILLGSITRVDGHQLLKLAREKNKDHKEYKYHFFMLSRAALLLRLSTGACARLTTEARIDKDDLKFWWMPLGVRSGLWEEGETDPFFVMWKDIEQALNNIKDKVPNTMQMDKWRAQHSGDILTLSGCERIGLAGICL